MGIFSPCLLTKATSDGINQDVRRSVFFLTDTSALSSSLPSLSACFPTTYNIFPFRIRVVSDVFFSGGDNSSEVASVTHRAANLTPRARLQRGRTYSVSVSLAGLSLVRRRCAQLLIWLTAPYLARLLLVYCRHPDRLERCAGNAGSARGIQSAAERTERHSDLLPGLCTN